MAKYFDCPWCDNEDIWIANPRDLMEVKCPQCNKIFMIEEEYMYECGFIHSLIKEHSLYNDRGII